MDNNLPPPIPVSAQNLSVLVESAPLPVMEMVIKGLPSEIMKNVQFGARPKALSRLGLGNPFAVGFAVVPRVPRFRQEVVYIDCGGGQRLRTPGIVLLLFIVVSSIIFHTGSKSSVGESHTLPQRHFFAVLQ